jgi:hypothetical protein
MTGLLAPSDGTVEAYAVKTSERVKVCWQRPNLLKTVAKWFGSRSRSGQGTNRRNTVGILQLASTDFHLPAHPAAVKDAVFVTLVLLPCPHPAHLRRRWVRMTIKAT